ncbi:MAG: hypothetical protein JSV80_15115 [Acidobacteriota bacterium]|nr:MAG: hypothetical protein JSV80_15115 [Acidobacteriota bacterium]
MARSLKVLLRKLIDYAGLFPPARLPLDEAIGNYARYRRQPEAWMLGRFICPASRLEPLEQHAALLDGGQPFAFSVLASGGIDQPVLLETLRADLEAINRFVERRGERVAPELIEIKLPAGLGDDDAIRTLVARAAVLLDECSPMALSPFYEVSIEGSWREKIDAAVCALSLHNLERREKGEAAGTPRAGVKLRCGGASAADYPSPEQIAHTLIACRDAKVPFKATAGLHHPIRHFNEPAEATMHGFLNVFGAGVLAHALGLSEQHVVDIVADQDVESFAFDDERLAWRSFSADLDAIAEARDRMMISFGSCSFDEPHHDLRQLALL